MNKRGAIGFEFLKFLGNLLTFFVLTILISIPYIIMNLDGIVSPLTGLSTSMKVWGFIFGVLGAVFKGLWLAFSTVGYSLIHMGSLFHPVKVGSLIFSVLYLAAAVAIVYQLVRMVFGIIDSGKQKASSGFLMFIFALFAVIVLSCIFYLVTGGNTILSGMKAAPQNSTEQVQNIPEPTMNDTIIEDIPDNLSNDSMSNSINMFT